jgi:ADP-ribosyl-[dinitrogen reductase] hydrolase
MMSDDTEHSCMVAESLIESGFDPERFEALFAKRLRWWLLGVPAGTGFATLRACLRLLCGIPSYRSGVFSAGNGPAMRAAILGAPSTIQRNSCNLCIAQLESPTPILARKQAH